jgi:hypothetical protein
MLRAHVNERPEVAPTSLPALVKDEKKIRELVARIPGAQVWQEGMKLPGQLEREEMEAEWMRGEFDPVGDLVVTGKRLERGEGRSADLATGPQCGEWDDCRILLRGTPVAGGSEPFYTPKGTEAALADRAETMWLVKLSDSRLNDYWRKSLRAMSSGDRCRFTCAAKKCQQVLQSLADCCLPPGETDDGSHSAIAAESLAEQPRTQLGPSGRDLVIEMCLVDWSPVRLVSTPKQPALYKRVLAFSAEQVARTQRSRDDQLLDELRHVGDGDSAEIERWDEAEGKPAPNERRRDGRRREPRPPDRVRLRYSVARRTPLGRLVGLPLSAGTASGAIFETSVEFIVGGGNGRLAQDGARAVWPILDQISRNLEEHERASFDFTATTEGLALGAPPLLSAGDLIEIEATLERLQRQKDVSRAKDNSVHKCKLATGRGYWRPRGLYRVTITAAAAPRSAPVAPVGLQMPKEAKSYQLVLGPGLLQVARGLQDLLYTMSREEVALVTAPPSELRPWPAGGPLSEALPAPCADGTVSLWVRLDSMVRIEAFANGSVRKETLNADDIDWLEKAFLETKGQLLVETSHRSRLTDLCVTSEYR